MSFEEAYEKYLTLGTTHLKKQIFWCVTLKMKGDCTK